MKIFVSWSGTRSKAVATLLTSWIKCVIQASKPWISTRDIDRGALWFSEIGDQLKETSVGVICLTQENKDRPWILFEAGALAKGLSSSRVCTFLIDLKSTDLEDPLAQFNHTFPDKESVWGLVQTLNASSGQLALEEGTLAQVFATYWPQFETGFAAALAQNPQKEKTKPRSEENVLNEILTTTRGLSNRLRALEVQTADEPSNKINSAAGLQEYYDRKLRDNSLANIARHLPVGGLINSNLQDFERRVNAKPGEEI